MGLSHCVSLLCMTSLDHYLSDQDTTKVGNIMIPPGTDTVQWLPAYQHPELLSAATHAAILSWMRHVPEVEHLVRVAEIDPAVSDTAAMSDAYGIPMHASVNCVLVAGRREGVERTAAVAVRASTRADINGAIKRLLAVRKASFVPVDRAVQDSGMEYGGITPVGLPVEWKVLLDSDIATNPEWVVIGSGVRRSKLTLPGNLLSRLPGTHVVENVALA